MLIYTHAGGQENESVSKQSNISCSSLSNQRKINNSSVGYFSENLRTFHRRFQELWCHIKIMENVESASPFSRQACSVRPDVLTILNKEFVQ